MGGESGVGSVTDSPPTEHKSEESNIEVLTPQQELLDGDENPIPKPLLLEHPQAQNHNANPNPPLQI